MKAAETDLQSIFEGTKQYVVPLFQRKYTWGTTQWQKLWDDLIELSKLDNPRDHFIGSIVTMPTTSVPEGVAKYLLIDGQQRTTTIFVLLAMIRDKLDNPEENEELNNTLIVNQYKKGSDHYKLLPTQDDRIPFQLIIDNKLRSSELVNDQVYKAYLFFERKFRRSNIGPKTLQKIVSNQLSIVSIVLGADDNPYLVFESLNGTGLPLSQADLIRNYFFMQIHTDEHETMYKEYWEPMQRSLGGDLTEFIRHFLTKSGTNIGQNDVYFALKERVSKGSAMDELKELTQFSYYYKNFLDPGGEPSSEIREMLVRTKRLETTTVYPFLLNCYDDYAKQKMSSDEFIDVLKIIENFLIRRYVCNIPTDRLKSIFPSLYFQALSKGRSHFVDSLKTLLQTKDYPKDTEFRKSLMESKLYGSRDRIKKTRIILEYIERSFNHKEQVLLSNPSLTIEHVMPQTLTPSWQEQLGEDWGLTHELFLHTLGNLTLSAYNAELSNAEFETKRDWYSNSHLEMNDYFSKFSSWGKEEIIERGLKLADIVIKIWPYFGDESMDTASNDDVTGTTPKLLKILGQDFEVHSWRDVLENTMNTISDLEPELFEKIVKDFPRLVGRDQSKFRAIRELRNGAFIEVNLAARAIQRYCVQALESIDLTKEDWKVDVVQNG